MPSHRGLGRRGAILLALMLGALAGWVVLAQRRPVEDAPEPGSAEASILDHVPADAFLVAEVNVELLRATELGRRLLGDGREVAGLGEIQTLCGTDPMNAVERLVVAVPEQDAVGFGLFAAGAAISAEAMLSCAEKIVSARGGRPARETRGRFGVLEDAGASLSSARLAVADGGPLVLGEPAYVDASLQLAEGKGASLAAAGGHADLRRRLEGSVVRATAVLSDAQRVTLRQELAAQQMADSPFRGIGAAGLGASVGRDLALHALVVCDDAASARGVADAIEQARRGEAKTPAAVVSGLDAVLDRLAVDAEGPIVELRLRLPVEDALALVQRLLALRRLAQGGTGQGATGAGAGGAARPGPDAAPAVSMERITPAPPEPIP